MAMTQCKECNKSVSDTAAVCPHCGTAAPALTAKQKAQATKMVGHRIRARMGGMLFFMGIGWMFFSTQAAGKEGFLLSGGMAKWIIGAGALLYVIAEIERNLDQRRIDKKKSLP